MGFFSKNKDENSGFIINTDDETLKISGDKNLAPHAMTADEVSSLWSIGDDDYTPTGTSALDALKKRMNVQSKEDDAPVIIAPKTERVVLKEEPVIQDAKPSEIVKSDIKPQVTVKKETPIQKKEAKTEPLIKNNQKTLLEKLKRYTVDEHGQDMSENKEPLYKLESVAEILLNDGESAMKNLSEKYGLDVVVDDLGRSKQTAKQEDDIKVSTPVTKAPLAKSATTPTPAFEQMVNDAEKREIKELYENLFPSEKQEVVIDTSVPDISDIDNTETETTAEKVISHTATVRFTPVKDSKGNTDHITISSVTKHIDFGDDIPDETEQIYTPQIIEQTDFDKFEPQAEMADTASGKKLMRSLAVKKRSLFVSSFVSFVSLLALLVFLLPPVYDFIISNPKGSMFTCGAFLLISTIANIGMFADFKLLPQKRCSFDTLASLCSVFTLSLSVCAAVTNSDAYHLILLGAIIIFVRALCKFKEISAMHGNLRQIYGEKQKNALTLINDHATTFAMAKNSIEGDVLVAAHRKTNFAEDFMKYTTYSPKLSGKTSLVFYITFIFSIVSGITAFFYYNNIFDAFYCATAIVCIATMPTLFFIDSLPLSFAAKKLNAKGAMIAGLYGAEKIETTNAVVVNINDIFPSGTVSMYSMKVLSDNNIDETILKAASLTAAVNSPLEAIFKQIAGTNSSYTIPDSDTVKYEKRLGISGWVDDELLFIGNRSLMEAHGIEMPSIEVDKKILRKGYFPVYVATANTACALIVIQYDVRKDIAKELRKIAELGLLLLVDNCDPNINEEMLCDYFGLYDDSVKIMSNAGVHMCKNATPDVQKCSAPATYRGSHMNLVRIINCASNIKTSNKILTIMYVLFAVLGAVYFVYAAFSGLASIPTPVTIIVYELAAAVLSIIGFLIRKP